MGFAELGGSMKTLNKKLVLVLALSASFHGALVLISSGYAGQIIRLVSGEQVEVGEYTVTCDQNSPTPTPPSSVGSTIQYRGDYLTFSRGPAGQLTVRYASSGRILDLGGVITNDPIAFVDSNGAARAMAYGTDGVYYSRTLTTDWEAYGGQLLENPSVVLLNGQTYIVGRGLDQAAYYRTLTQGWTSLGGGLSTPLSVSVIGNDLFIQAFGTDGRLYDRTLNRDWQLSR